MSLIIAKSGENVRDYGRQRSSNVFVFAVNDNINDMKQLCHKPDGLLVSRDFSLTAKLSYTD